MCMLNEDRWAADVYFGSTQTLFHVSGVRDPTGETGSRKSFTCWRLKSNWGSKRPVASGRTLIGYSEERGRTGWWGVRWGGGVSCDREESAVRGRGRHRVTVHFCSGIRSSMDSPASRRFSMSTSRLTPSTTIWTSSTSEKPRRSALEMSKTPPTAAVSTPPDRHIQEVNSQGQGWDCHHLKCESL